MNACLQETRRLGHPKKFYQLLVIRGPQQGACVTLFSTPFQIGRAASCQLRIMEPFVSRRHCRIERQENELWLLDLDSQNGTRVNGERVYEQALLHDGDLITLGNTAILVRDADEESSHSQQTQHASLVCENDETLPDGVSNHQPAQSTGQSSS